MAFTQTPFEHFLDARVVTVSRSARWLDLEAKGWCNEQRTDGALPAAVLGHITDADDPQADAAELVKSGLWTATADGWQLDWSHQELKNRVQERQKLDRDRQTSYRERSKLHGEGDHSKCLPKYCKEVRNNALVTRDSRNDSRVTNASPYHPRPTQPIKAGEGLGNAAKSRPASGPSGPAAGEPRRGKGSGVRVYTDANGDMIFGGN